MSKKSLEWMYGIVTVPSRRTTLFKQTLESLCKAGFDKPRLFVDGPDSVESYAQFGLPITSRCPSVGIAANWMMALWELYSRNPQADRYAIFQDDVLTYPNLRDYLTRCEYPVKSYLNLCTYPANQELADGRKGWYPSNQLGRGAQALVFNREAVVTLLSNRHPVMRLQRSGKGHRGIDGSISHALRNEGFREYVHNPSLVYHIGTKSTVGNRPQPLVESFQGEEFDATSLPGTFHDVSNNGLELGHRCLVAGAGGFIGGHLVRRLVNEGYAVTAVDIKPLSEWWQVDKRACNRDQIDLREGYHCQYVCIDQEQVFNLAADMGGIGFIENNKADCMTSVLINANLLRASLNVAAQRYFYASSACVYHADLQRETKARALREEDAYYGGGAMPEDGYGWEKLFSERMCHHFHKDYGLETRIGRFHNIYGPHGSWRDGREKAPAALCRKVATAKLNIDSSLRVWGQNSSAVWEENSIEIWGDGTQSRSFCYIDDCVEGILRLTLSDVRQPINIGSNELVTINDLLAIVAAQALGSGYQELKVNYDTNKPQGVVGRNSDNSQIKRVLKWEPTTPLVEGITKTYAWIEEEVRRAST